ncbi:solute carrier family 23 member 2-like [Apostichopus japonicus]|uniref:solute carrier family 23 member 2-like n=1 Tax=Stichopus japonicus TaxID=307972 RepID=UPI003AB2B766
MAKNGNSKASEQSDPPVTISLVERDEGRSHDMIYGIEERPPWTSIVLMGVQHFSVSFSGMLTMPLLLAGPMCFHLDRDLISQLIATSFFLCGITTLLQTGLGSRLPIVQGASMTFVLPAIVMMNLRGPCPTPLTANATEEEIQYVREVAFERIREIQGSLCLASLVQLVVGFSGIVGLLLPFIGPITIATELILIAIPLIPIASDACGTNWGISCICIFFVVLFSQFLDKYDIPCPKKKKFALFTFFPILLAVGITWVLCLVLTITNVFPEDPSEYGYKARTDVYTQAIKDSVWIRIPYPGQWGFPTASASGFIGMLAAIISGIVESVGDYHACALIGGAPRPPVHAINRGIGFEGLGCLAAGLWGSGAGYTSYSNNIATIGLTKIASRAVIYFSAILFIISGICAKFTSFCAALPEPIIGAMMATTFGMVASIGFANLSYVKVNTSRNLFILGMAVFAGIGVPDYLIKNPDALNTGSDVLDQVLEVTLGSSMLIGGITACLLDNFVRGTPEERGINWGTEENQTTEDSPCYNLPFGMAWINGVPFLRRLPFSPTFTGFKKISSLPCRRQALSRI